MNLRKIDSMHFNQQTVNLLDLVLPATTADTNIHTFSEFKEWITNNFHPKTQLNSSSYIKKNELVQSLKIKPSKSLTYEINSDAGLLGSVKRRPSISYLGQINQTGERMESSNLGQPSITHSRKNIANGDILNYGMDLRQNSIIGSKSAHSSRSFNGYDQINQYELRDVLGKGSFAEVRLGVDTESQNKQKYAIKVLQTKQIKKKFLLKKNSQAVDSTPQQQNQGEQSKSKVKQSLASMFVKNQVAILKKMDHQYITKLYEVIVDSQKSKVYLVLQYCGNGFINQSKTNKGQYRKLLQSECKRYYKQLAAALNYVHNVAKIAHRDIKPENLLLSENDQVKISDFGLGTHKLKGQKQSGTPLYMSPEALNNQQEISSQSSDIWALGVTLLVLLTGKHPQFANNRIDTKKVISNLKDVSQNCKDFLSKCLQIDVKKRITAEQLLNHTWLGGIQGAGLRNSSHDYSISITAADEQNLFKDRMPRKQKQNVIKILNV